MQVIDSSRRTLLHYAARGDEWALNFLLKKKIIDINAKDNFGATPLLYAAKYGNESCLTLLKQADFTVVDDYGGTILHHLCLNNRFEENMTSFLEMATALGLHPFQQTNDGNTPAHYAAKTNNTIALQFFFTNFQFPVDFVNEYVFFNFFFYVYYKSQITCALRLDEKI